MAVDRFQTMRTFVQVAKDGGFTAAARSMGVDQALVTRQIADLEHHLGIKLLERTTRKVRLTEAGEIYLARCRDILGAVGDAEAEVSRAHQEMAGRVRIALPTVFSLEQAADQLALLHREYPDICVDVVLTDQPIDPVDGAFDVATTYAHYPVSATAIARDFLQVPYVLCASPNYLQNDSELCAPADLARHHCVVRGDTTTVDKFSETWTLEKAGEHVENVDMVIALRASTYLLCLEAVRSGMDIGRLPETLVARDIAEGRLQALMPDWQAGALSFKLVYPGRKMIPRRVRYVIDAIFAQRDEAGR